jgi:tripartite-type tricarboxylate transporter receptor subunit TctC
MHGPYIPRPRPPAGCGAEAPSARRAMKGRATVAGTGAVVALLAVAVAAPLAAQPFPSRPIRIVVGFPAGGGADLAARAVGQRVAEKVGQPVVVENRPGASSNIAAELVARSSPDGYTLFAATINVATSPALFPKLAWDPLKDFAPISLISKVPIVLVVNPAVPARTVKEYVALAKRQAGATNFASSGSGSAGHLSGELFRETAGVNMVHVPYKGSPPALADVIGGHVDAMFDGLLTALPQIRAGKVRALAVSTAERAAALPEVPTMAESGLRGFDTATWTGLLAPRLTPVEVLNRLNAEVVKALGVAEVRDRLVAQGANVVPTTREAFDRFLRAEIERWRKVIEASGAKAD